MTGAFSIAPGVRMYQLTDTCLIAEIKGKESKYYKDSDLKKVSGPTPWKARQAMESGSTN